ncbi:MAG: c-type cytochrome [Pseudohongiella sp.]|nr:c-type cytochrome [Pseudohongiella sp.]
MLNLGLKSRVAKIGLLVLGISIAGTVMAQSTREQQIAQRLQPVGSVCLAGEACAAGGPAATSTPAVAQASTAAFSAQGTYDQYCAMCHNTGMAGAPRREDAAHWTARIEEIGLGAIVTNAINGINAMPPRGMCATCTDEQISEVVEYLSGASAQ